jgi:hypothetical protein
VSVTVTNPDGQTAMLAGAFTYQVPPPPPPSITGINPTLGPAAGGTQVTIFGTGFINGATVKFGSTPAPGVTFGSALSLLATAPAGTGTVGVTVTNPDGQSATLQGAFTYQAPAPLSITGINPVSGRLAGGTVVTISGSGFVSASAVKFGSASATVVSFLSSTSLQATTPTGSGTVGVTVMNPDGQSATLPNAFTYQNSMVTIQAAIQGCKVSGTVSGLSSPQNYKIVMYAQTNQFYIQPCDTEPLNPIASNGTWGPLDSHSGTIYVLVVRSGYNPPPATSFLPAVDGVNVLAMIGPVGTLSGCDVSRCPAQ